MENTKRNGITWKDSTSYSRGEDRKPTCWSASIGAFHVTVLSSHLYYPGVWVSHCSGLWDCWELQVATREEAMDKAVARLRSVLADSLAAIDR